MEYTERLMLFAHSLLRGGRPAVTHVHSDDDHPAVSAVHLFLIDINNDLLRPC